MKKLILKLLCLSLFITAFAGCSKKEKNTEEEINNTVILDNIGLSYTTPKLWEEYQKTNIYPITQRGENTFAEITYLYLTADEVKALDAGEKTISQTGEAICQIVVAKKGSYEKGKQSSKAENFEESEKVSEQGDFGYYFLSGSKSAKSTLSEEDLIIYNKLVSAAKELKASISTKSFDPSLLDEQANFFNQYLTFETESINGETVTSKIFGNADITIVNFGATYAYPDLNEIPQLQELYGLLKNIKETKVNLLYAVIDTPQADAEAIVKNELKTFDAEFLTIKMDDYLANWVLKNLEGLPSTVFVDNSGKVIGETIKGTKTSDEYMAELNKKIEELSEQ